MPLNSTNSLSKVGQWVKALKIYPHRHTYYKKSMSNIPICRKFVYRLTLNIILRFLIIKQIRDGTHFIWTDSKEWKDISYILLF